MWQRTFRSRKLKPTCGRLKAMLPELTLGCLLKVNTYLCVKLRTVTCLHWDKQIGDRGTFLNKEKKYKPRCHRSSSSWTASLQYILNIRESQNKDPPPIQPTTHIHIHKYTSIYIVWRMVTCTRGDPTHCSKCGSFSLMTAQLVNDSSSVGHLAACITWNKESREACKQRPQWEIHIYRQRYISQTSVSAVSDILANKMTFTMSSGWCLSDVLHQFCAGTFTSCWLVSSLASVLWDYHWVTTCVKHFSYFICFIINQCFCGTKVDQFIVKKGAKKCINWTFSYRALDLLEPLLKCIESENCGQLYEITCSFCSCYVCSP